jgi:hypothetical protein
VVRIGVHKHNRVIAVRSKLAYAIREIVEEMAAFG